MKMQTFQKLQNFGAFLNSIFGITFLPVSMKNCRNNIRILLVDSFQQEKRVQWNRKSFQRGQNN